MWMDVDTAVVVPMSIAPIMQTDGLTIEQALVYNFAGIAVQWNFVTSAGAYTCTSITPTTAGVYDISEPVANVGMYGIEIPASGGASANNDTEGFGWITGKATGLLPWRGPIIGFRAAGLNNSLIDSASTPLEVNVVKWLTTTVETPAVAGRPSVDAVKVDGNTPTTVAQIADGVWDEAASGHLTQGTFGELFAGVRANSATAGAATTITLDAAASAVDDFYNGCLIKIVAGTGVGQRRWITDYVGSTKVATIDTAWATNPDNTSKFVVL